RFAEDGHIATVASECGGVLAHPFERAHEIEGAEVTRAFGLGRAGVAQGRVPEPAEGPETVVHGEHDDMLRRRERAAVVEAAVPDGISAAVNPEHDGETCVARTRVCGRPDIDVETVLVAHRLARSDVGEATEGARELRARRSEFDRFPGARPREGR